MSRYLSAFQKRTRGDAIWRSNLWPAGSASLRPAPDRNCKVAPADATGQIRRVRASRTL